MQILTRSKYKNVHDWRRGWVGKGKAESVDAKHGNVPHISEFAAPANLELLFTIQRGKRMYWILLAESLLLTIYACRLHRESFAIAWALVRGIRHNDANSFSVRKR